MWNRNALVLVAGAAIFALDASSASAQDTTRARPTSSQRISIKKEAGGEVTPPVIRVDTVFSYRTDTLRLPGRTDTVVRTNTVVRVDTVSIPRPFPRVGGLYFGIAAGSALPAANFNDSDHPGWNIEGMLGVDPIGSPFGARITAGYSNYSPHSYVSPFLDNAQIFTAGLDGKLRIVAITPLERRIQLYGVGGFGYNRYRNILENNHGQLSIGNRIFLNGQIGPADDSWHNGWGYNVGGGGEMGFGRANLFVETRFTSFSAENSWVSRVPLIVGVSWF